MDCNILVGVYLPTVDTCWWTMDWDRRDVLLVWMGFWGRCTWWGWIPNSSCCCLVIKGVTEDEVMTDLEGL